MDYPNHNTEHQLGKHLTFEDYVTIQVRLKDGWTANKIAVKELHCAPNTVRNMIKKGVTPLYHGEERPQEVETREEFGHWETDLVIGQKSGQDNVLLTLLERKTRQLSIIRIPDKSAESVMDAFTRMKEEFGASYSQVFRTITTDNGSEFSRLSAVENGTQTKVYFSHVHHQGIVHPALPACVHMQNLLDAPFQNLHLSLDYTYCRGSVSHSSRGYTSLLQ